VGPVDNADLDARRFQFDRARDPGDARSHHHDSLADAR
jgi:hypothetical protein